MRLFKNNLDRRKARVRRNIKQKAKGRLRLSVFRSSKHIYVQLINDATGQTVAAASSWRRTSGAVSRPAPIKARPKRSAS